MTFSPRTLESTWRGGRQGTGRSGNKSSVRQRSVRSTLPRRRRKFWIFFYGASLLLCSVLVYFCRKRVVRRWRQTSRFMSTGKIINTLTGRVRCVVDAMVTEFSPRGNVVSRRRKPVLISRTSRSTLNRAVVPVLERLWGRFGNVRSCVILYSDTHCYFVELLSLSLQRSLTFLPVNPVC